LQAAPHITGKKGFAADPKHANIHPSAPLASLEARVKTREKNERLDAKMNVIGYVRRSREENGNLSIETQGHAIQAWCKANGHELVAVYQDNDISGAIVPMDRPGASQAIKHACRRGFGLLLVPKLDRISRDLADTLDLVDNILGKRASLVSIAENFDASTAAGRMYLQIVSTFAEFERRRIQQRTREGLATVRRQGRKTGGSVPFGYMVDGTMLMAHPGEMPTVERAITLRNEGWSWAKVSEELNERGFVRRGGLLWTGNKLYRLLKSELRRRADAAA